MGDEIVRELTLRERLAIRLIGLASWALPDGHHAISAMYYAASEIEQLPDSATGER